MPLFFFVSFTLSFCLRDSQITDLLSPSAPIFGILQRGSSGYSPVRFSRTPESIIPSAGFRLLSCNLLLARYVVSLMLLL